MRLDNGKTLMTACLLLMAGLTVFAAPGAGESSNKDETENVERKKSVKKKKPSVIEKDTANWEIVYIHVEKDLKDKTKERAIFEMLSVGDNYRWYGGYGDFQMDSIRRHDSARLKGMTLNERVRLREDLELIDDEMLFCREDSMMDYYGHFFLNDYTYREILPQMEWRLEEGTKEVLGYECQKATTNWRGRDWIAWYCDIPESAGPWKFNGLPGLILSLEDYEKDHLFEAVESKNYKYPIGYQRKLHSKTTREKYNDGKREYMQNAGKVFMKSGMAQLPTKEQEEEMSKRRLFYNPIELE